MVISSAKNAKSLLTKVKGKLSDVGTVSGAFAKAFGKTYTVEIGKYANTLFGGFAEPCENCQRTFKGTYNIDY